MSLSSLLERLRDKPKEVRVQASFLTALSVTGVIGLLWGVTLPTRLQGLPQSNQTAQAEDENSLTSFFADTKNNLGQLIGATGEPIADDANNQIGSTSPKSDTYRVGAPTSEVGSYNDYPLEEQEPVVKPVDRREVRIGTTTSNARGQESE